jgi:predicted alpha-1,2-mannosidase
MTCELNQDDYALSQLAQALGHADDAQALLARSRGYQKLFDPATGLLRWHDADGGVPDDSFDPGSFSQYQEYVEADDYQTQFCAQWDAEGLAQLWGGSDKLVAGLAALFEESRTEREAAEADAARQGKSAEPNLLAVNLPPRYYFGGNEPDIHYAYLFAQAGRPDLTQQWVPWLRSHYFSSQPAGLPGNDDGGAMSAWYVFSALGLYPVPGSDRYVVGTPLFPKVEMALPGGTFTVTAQGVSAENIYVQSATLNGAPLNAAVLHRADLKPGGALTLVMGSSPSTWARAGN